MIRRLHRMWEKNWPELHCAVRAGMPTFVASPRPREPGACIPAFCYHRIDEVSLGRDLAFLKRNGYETLDADQLVAHMEGLQAAPARAVVLTIDDGMRDLYTRAFPLLREYGARAVAFIAPGLHDGAGAAARSRLCSWVEIDEMHLSGVIDFQSHTLEHRLVSKWPEPSGIRDCSGWLPLQRRVPLTLTEDLTAARKLLERRLRKRVVHMAFPQYAGTATGVRAAMAAGYRSLWWGVFPGRRGNDVADPLTHIVRLSGDFLQRLPGDGRMPLASILVKRVRRGGIPAALPAPERQRKIAKPRVSAT